MYNHPAKQSGWFNSPRVQSWRMSFPGAAVILGCGHSGRHSFRLSQGSNGGGTIYRNILSEEPDYSPALLSPEATSLLQVSRALHQIPLKGQHKHLFQATFGLDDLHSDQCWKCLCIIATVALLHFPQNEIAFLCAILRSYMAFCTCRVYFPHWSQRRFVSEVLHFVLMQ